MVEGANDSEALSAAEVMQTKAYLVYLQMELEIPFPDKPWYRYRVSPIAPSLRAEDKDRGYAPDMCVPIFPNTSHPLGRTPVRTDPVFPYNNCYHWAEFKTDIRVRARPEKFDERRGTLLPSTEYIKMDDYVGEDIPRMDELQRQHRAATGWQFPAVQPRVPSLEGSLHRHQTSASASTSSVNSGSSYADSSLSEESEDSVDVLAEVFAGPNQDVDALPLVDLWLELAENLKQEDIPNPLEFFEECDAIKSIIQAARERAYAVVNAPHQGMTSKPEAALAQLREVESAEVDTKGPTRSLLRMPKLPRKWSLCLKSLTNRVRRSRVVRAPSAPE
ncbi:hypothetical protein TRAPUB_733 [Trametes pubescens]|uniref:Uncharacterized protein n=1 Tax=Trametes pubescens TaxID=154538 RepID=A0A1M2VLA3_TRAPU|nr:hypothetical protein TRAPUB_733 [Trametes pubescens]